MPVDNVRAALEWAADFSDASRKLRFEGRAHRYALAAKEAVFVAQDEVSRAWNTPTVRPAGKRAALLRKFERRLARVRAELEQLDNDALAYMYAGGEL